MIKKYSDKELMKELKVDKKMLDRFKQIQKETIWEAGRLGRRTKKFKILGISGSARSKDNMAREDSNSEELLKRCLASFDKRICDTELLPLRDYHIEHCNACYSTANTQCHFYCSCYPKGTPLEDEMTKILYDKVLEADAIIFATPVNNYAMSTLMKTFIDRSISLDGSLKPADPNDPKNKELNKKHMRFVELTSNDDIPGSGMLKRFIGKAAGFIITGHEEGASLVLASLYMYLNGCGMVFPPFNYIYAMSSVCNSTYKDKEIVTSSCYDKQVKLLAQNLTQAVKLSRINKPTVWKYDAGVN